MKHTWLYPSFKPASKIVTKKKSKSKSKKKE